MELTTTITKKILRAIFATADEEINCGKCYKQVEEFVELELGGKSPEEAMPLVKEHLQRCEECREEYNALFDALNELQ